MIWLFLAAIVVWLVLKLRKKPSRKEANRVAASSAMTSVLSSNTIKDGPHTYRQDIGNGSRLSAQLQIVVPDRPIVLAAIEVHKWGKWWMSAFTESERALILERFQPSNPVENNIVVQVMPAEWFVKRSPYKAALTIAEGLNTVDLAHLGLRFITKVRSNLNRRKLIDRYYEYTRIIELAFRSRHKDTNGLSTTHEWCHRMIESIGNDPCVIHGDTDLIASHPGFERLAIDSEKAGDYTTAIAWCERAEREGWSGDWVERIERCRKKAAKRSKGMKNEKN